MRKVMNILLIAMALVAFISFISYIYSPYNTQIVQYSTFEESFETTGYVICSQTIISDGTQGALETVVADGERVQKDQLIGALINGALDESAMDELSQISNRIASIKHNQNTASVYAIDDAHLDSAIKEYIQKLTQASTRGNFDKAATLKNELYFLVDRKSGVSIDSASAALLSELENRKKQIESQIGTARKEIYAPVAGMFSTKVDALDKVVTAEAIPWLTVSQVESFEEKLNDKELAVVGGCKIVNNHKWNIVMLLDQNEASSLKVGSSVLIDFDSAAQSLINAKVTYISEVENEKAVVAIEGNRFVEGLVLNRVEDIRVIKSQNEGLRIPAQALRVVNDETGVYVLSGKDLIFKKVDIVYKSDDFYLVKENKSTYSENETPPLRLYDNIVTNPEEGL